MKKVLLYKIEIFFWIKTKKLRYLAKMISTINNQYETRIINHSSIKQGLNNPAKYKWKRHAATGLNLRIAVIIPDTPPFNWYKCTSF